MKSGTTGQISWGTVAGGVLLLLYLSYHYGYQRLYSRFGTSSGTEEMTDLNSIQRLKAENAELKQQWIATQQQAQIAIEAKRSLEDYLRAVEKNNAKISHDLAIVHTVKGIEPQNEFTISHFQIYATEDPNTFRYMLMLSRQTSSDSEPIQGSVKMTITGRVGKKLIFLPVKYEESFQVDGLGFHCQDYQELSGELTLPDQFEPLEVLFKVHTAEGEQSQQVFIWQTA